MSLTLETGRVDQLALALVELLVRRSDPWMARIDWPVIGRIGSAWTPGLAGLVEERLRAAGVPATPVTAVRVGRLDIPLPVLQWIGEAAGIFPGGAGRVR
jgi:hypothetical protein